MRPRLRRHLFVLEASEIIASFDVARPSPRPLPRRAQETPDLHDFEHAVEACQHF
jgi:hypothetical protein